MLLIIVYVCRLGLDAKCTFYCVSWSKLEDTCLDAETGYTHINWGFPRSHPLVGNWLHQQRQLKIQCGFIC